MYKKLYESPIMTVDSFELKDIIVMSGGDGFGSDQWDNSTSGGINV